MRDDCHVCGAKLERGSPHRATCAPLPVPLIRVCMYVQTMNHVPLLHPPSPPNAIPCIPLQPLPLSVRLREPSNFVKTATTVVTVAVVALFPPPSFFSPPCSYTRHEPTTTRTGTTMGIPRVCTRSYPDIWPSPVSKCFPVAEGGGRVVPLILNCYVGFTSVSPSITSR